MRRGRPERFIVMLDDEQEVILTPETVLKFGVAPERDYTDKEFLKLLEEDNLRQAKDQALRYLSVRPHSRLELVRKMFAKGYRNPVIDRALDELEKIDLLNDEEFTRLFIQNELRLRPAGRLLLIRKLGERGIARELYEPLLAELFPEELENEMARNLALKFIKSHRRDSGRKLTEKLFRYLQGKGFTWEQIRQVLDREDEG